MVKKLVKKRITKKHLKYLIKDEKKASREYSDIFLENEDDKRFKVFREMAIDEANHAKNLERILKKL